MAVIEWATLRVREGEGDVLEGRLGDAVAELEKADGVVCVTAYRCVEEPDEFSFGIEWTSVEAHLAYRETEGFARYRGMIADLLAGPPSFLHFSAVAASARHN